MFHRKAGTLAADRTVWRIDAAHPGGVYISTGRNRRHPAQPAQPGEAHERWWRASSQDLLQGAQVCETTLDTLPGELIDAFDKAGR